MRLGKLAGIAALSAALLGVATLGCSPSVSTGTGGGMGSGGGTGSGGKACGDCAGFTCCDGVCVNTNNDVHDCGGCGRTCGGVAPYCDKGTCGDPPCDGVPCPSMSQCCGASCCGEGKLCCTVPGPVGDVTSCQDPTDTGTCPTGCLECKCASPDTPIATPRGPRAIATLEVGNLVYSVRDGGVVVAPLVAVHRQAAPDHRVVHVDLANGEALEMSPRHPTADGRTFGEVRAGDRLDGVLVVGARVVPYAFTHTFDVLPDTETGAYFAGGVLVGSTLRGPDFIAP